MVFTRVTLKNSAEMKAGEREESLALFSHMTFSRGIQWNLFIWHVRQYVEILLSSLIGSIFDMVWTEYQIACWHHWSVKKKYLFSSVWSLNFFWIIKEKHSLTSSPTNSVFKFINLHRLSRVDFATSGKRWILWPWNITFLFFLFPFILSSLFACREYCHFMKTVQKK